MKQAKSGYFGDYSGILGDVPVLDLVELRATASLG